MTTVKLDVSCHIFIKKSLKYTKNVIMVTYKSNLIFNDSSNVTDII